MTTMGLKTDVDFEDFKFLYQHLFCTMSTMNIMKEPLTRELKRFTALGLCVVHNTNMRQQLQSYI